MDIQRVPTDPLKINGFHRFGSRWVLQVPFRVMHFAKRSPIAILSGRFAGPIKTSSSLLSCQEHGDSPNFQKNRRLRLTLRLTTCSNCSFSFDRTYHSEILQNKRAQALPSMSTWLQSAPLFSTHMNFAEVPVTMSVTSKTRVVAR